MEGSCKAEQNIGQGRVEVEIEVPHKRLKNMLVEKGLLDDDKIEAIIRKWKKWWMTLKNLL